MWWIDSKLRRFEWWRKWRGLPPSMTLEEAQRLREVMAIVGGALERCHFGEVVNNEFDLDWKSPTPGTIKMRKPTRYIGGHLRSKPD